MSCKGIGNGTETNILFTASAMTMSQNDYGIRIQAIGGDQGSGHLYAAGFIGQGGGLGVCGNGNAQNHQESQNQGRQLLHD